MITAERYHDISVGHRVCGHESKCVHLHGHNYRITFTINGDLDSLGRVLDFGVIKSHLCDWLENNWDHKFLMWEIDPMLKLLDMREEMEEMNKIGGTPAVMTLARETVTQLADSLIPVPFNPTAENMAEYLLHIIGPQQLEGTGAILVAVRVEETRKCSATSSLSTTDFQAEE